MSLNGNTYMDCRGGDGGKAYKRGVEYNITISLVIMMMRFDAIASALPHGHIRVHSSILYIDMS